MVSKRYDDHWQPYVSLVAGGPALDTCDLGGAPSCSAGGDDFYLNDPNADLDRQTYRDLQGISATSFTVGLLCRANSNHICGNGGQLPEADATIYSAFFTIADPSAPSVGSPVGEGWTTGAWSQGSLPLSLSSSDNTGIASTKVYADGSLIAVLQRSCSYDQPRPCTDEPVGDVGLPTAGLPDGLHTIAVGASDAAGNESLIARSQQLRVDNRPPAAPVGLAAVASASAVNRFSATWSLPPDAGTPIVSARYEVCQGGTCGAVQTAPQLTRLDDLALPAPGDATLRVWLVDGLGHERVAGGSVITLTYQPLSPPESRTSSPTTQNPTPGAQGPERTTPAFPSAPAKAAPALKIAAVQRVGRRLTITGTVSPQASGRVTVRYRAADVAAAPRTVTHHVPIRGRRFRAAITLPKPLANAHRATISVTYGGDSDTSAATARTLLRTRR
jgi:hypothetical protein